MLDLTALQAEIARDEQVNTSAIALLSSLAAELEASKNDPVAIQALVDSLKANQDSLAAAVAQNTPAAPAA